MKMTTDKLKELITNENERLENEAASTASEIINEIARYQKAKLDADTKIEELRKQLKEIQVASLDATSILGG